MVAAEFTTIAEAVCPLEGIRIKRETDNNFVYGYTVQVSYDGTYVSNGTDLYIFDSTCQNVEERDGEMTFSILVCFVAETSLNRIVVSKC